MSEVPADPRCPECGEPIGATATYCMHCSADLTEERADADADEDGVWDQAEATSTDIKDRAAGIVESSSGSAEPDTVEADPNEVSTGGSATTADDGTGQLLDPDGVVDNTLTVVVGIVGGFLVGIFGTIIGLLTTGGGWAMGIGFVAWLGATAYLVRRRTVQEAVAKSGYAVALVLLVVPVMAFSPVVPVDGGIEERGGLFVVWLLFAAVPAGIAAVIGWIAAQFVPAGDSGSEG